MLRQTRAPHILVGTLHLARLHVLPTHQPHGVVEQQLTLRGAAAHQQHSVLVGQVLTREPVVVYVVENVYIVNQYGLVGGEQRCRSLQSPTRLEQLRALVAEVHQRRIGLLAHIVDNLLGEVVDVHNETVVQTRGQQLLHHDVEQGPSTHPDECLRHRVGKRAKPCSKPGGEYHRLFHAAKVRISERKTKFLFGFFRTRVL